ncbi:MAG: helix-turn-helix domain-containing protein [Candidatus Nanopelagicales bacterium]
MSRILDIHGAFTYFGEMDLVELGATIRRTRLASGVSQAQMARMADVSRATINYVQTGRSAIGANALLRILPPLRMSIAPSPSVAGRADRPAVELLAASASVRFKETIPVAKVERALVTGAFADPWLLPITTIIDEASNSLLQRAVREIAAQTSLPIAAIWRNLRALAQTVSSPNTRWA